MTQDVLNSTVLAANSDASNAALAKQSTTKPAKAVQAHRLALLQQLGPGKDVPIILDILQQLGPGKDVLIIDSQGRWDLTALKSITGSVVMQSPPYRPGTRTTDFPPRNIWNADDVRWSLPLSDASVDLVGLFGEKDTPADWPNFLLEARRILRPGGLLVLSTKAVPGYEKTGETKALIRNHFPVLQEFSQRLLDESLMSAEARDAVLTQPVFVASDRRDNTRQESARDSAISRVLVASDRPLSVPALFVCCEPDEPDISSKRPSEVVAPGLTQCYSWNEEIANLRAEVQILEAQLTRERRASAWRDSMLRAELTKALQEINQENTRQVLQPLENIKRSGIRISEDIAHLQRHLIAIYASRSWRFTAPLRAVALWLRGLPTQKATSPACSAVELQGQIDGLLASRSWRITHPMRSITNRLLRTSPGSNPRLLAPTRKDDSLLQSSAIQMRVEALQGVLVVADTLPFFDRSSGGLRLFTMLELIASSGAKVTFACIGDRKLHDEHLLTLADRERYEDLLAARGIKRILYGQAEIEAALEAPGGTLKSALVAFPEVARCVFPCIRAHAPGANIIYDMVDFHAVRLEREAHLRKDLHLLARSREIRLVELANIDAADLTLAITEDERRAVLEAVPDANVTVLPNIFRIPPASPSGPEGREGIFFIGGFWHQPNIDAVLWFCQEIWPLIHAKVPEAQIRIAGSGMSDEVIALGRIPGVKILGYVKDLAPLYDQARLSVAPLRYGAGMKGKVGQSMAYGLPVVATSIGAEGMSLSHGKDLLVADTPTDFAEAVIRLMRDDGLWRHLQTNARQVIADQFSSEIVAHQLKAILRG